MKSRLLENAMRKTAGEPLVALVDLGYAKDQGARDRADKLLTMVARSNLSIEGFGRILVRVPKTKLEAVLKAFPIKEGSTYYGSTHNWLEADRKAGAK